MYDEFKALDIAVIAVAQEDKDLETHGQFHQRFKPEPRFEIAADLERRGTERYGRTTSYLIDKQGIVRQVFPQTLHFRADWEAILEASREALKPDDGSR